LRHATRPIRERRRANVSVTLFGVLAVSFMMVMYALEPRGRRFIALFALGCALSSVYDFAANTWPFGAVEAIWTVVALRRWQRCA
jgi:hypothetical protein